MADPTMMTDEELFGSAAEPSSPKGATHSSPTMMTDEELFGSAKPGVLSRSADEGWLSGAAKGAATGVIKGVANIPGYAGNVRAMGDALSGWALGEKPEELRKKREAHSLLPALIPEKWLPTGAELSAPVLEKTGEYKPESTVGKVAQAGLEAGISALGPGSGMLAKGAKPVATAIETGRQLPLNVVSGSAAEGAYDLTHHAGLSFLAGMAAPGAVEHSLNIAKNVTRPAFTRNHEGMAAEYLQSHMTDPNAVRETLWPSTGPTQDFVLQARNPKTGKMEPSKPTLAQLTGDVGLLAAERAVINKDNKTAFSNNETNRNSTRLNALREIEPQADPREVANLVRDYHNRIDQTLAAEEARLTKEAQTKAERLGPSANPEEIGFNLRQAIESARAKAKAERNELYRIDPEGKLNTVVAPIRAHADETMKGISPYAPPLTPDADRVFNIAKSFPDVIKYNDLIDFDKNVTDALSRELRTNGETNSWRLLSQLKTQTQSAIDNALENQHAYEQAAKARGEIAPEDTLYERLLAKWRSDSRAASGQGERVSGAGADGGSGAASVLFRDESPAGARSKTNGGNQAGAGEEPLQPNFDEAAGTQLAAAKQAHRDYSTAYKAEPVAGTIRTTGFAGQYRMPSSAIPAKAFVPGDRGYQTAQAFLKAAKDTPEAVPSMQDAALNALRKNVKDGVLPPDKLAKWKADHAGALRALDEKVPGFSKGFDDAAKATEKLTDFAARQKQLRDAFKESAFGDFIGLREPDEIQNAVGSMLTAPKGAVANVRQMVKGMSPEAVEGMRKAAVDWVVRTMTNTAEAVGSDEKKLSYAKIDSLIKNNGSALEQLFTPEQMKTLRAIHRDMELSDRTRQAALSPTNPSGTAKDMHASLEALSKQIKETSLMMAMWNEVSSAAKEGPFQIAKVGIPAAVLAGVTHYNAMGAGKVSMLVREALQDPAIARQLLMKVPAKQIPQRFATLSNSVRRGLLSSMQNDELSERPQRMRRASGGRAMAPKPQTAQSLLAAVKRARKAIQSQTEAILAQPDEHVVRALSVANEKI